MRKRNASFVAAASLVLAVVAYVPSAAAFTPAVLFSFVAAVGAIFAACSGSVRVAVITLLVVVATVLISPVFFPSFAGVHLGRTLLELATGIAAVALILLWDFRRRNAGV